VGARALFFAWQNIARRYPPPFCCTERYVLRHANQALAGSKEAKEVLRTKGYSGPISVIPQFGVDPDMYRFSVPRPLDENGGSRPFIVGYSGRLVREKGVDLLLRAAAGLEGMWQLWLLGEGPERRRLVDLVEELDLVAHVVFKGMMPPSHMPDVYPLLDALVLPSRTRANWKEQFGRVLIEAMSCGVPVVGSDSGEIPHVIGEAGLVFPEGDVAALRSALERLRRDYGLRKRLATRGRARVLAQYTQAQVATATYDVYADMMKMWPGEIGSCPSR
jgi:glycosyltransferase involved in cell wall biosynthesis